MKSLFVSNTVIEIGLVREKEFFQIEGSLPNHIKIERALADIGGGGWRGLEFKETALKVAGWHDGSKKPYSHDPQQAAHVFNKIRILLSQKTSHQDSLIKRSSYFDIDD